MRRECDRTIDWANSLKTMQDSKYEEKKQKIGEKRGEGDFKKKKEKREEETLLHH